jgi:zinc-finger of acetyl-transferase ESCO
MAVRAYGWSGGSAVRTYGKKSSSSSGSTPFASPLEFSPPPSNTLRAGAPAASRSLSGQPKPKVSIQKPQPVSCCSLANLSEVPAVRRKPAATPTQISSRKRQRGAESTSTSSIGTASKRSTSTKSSKKGQQLFLDYGQKSFGKREQCPLCGMLWVKGDVTDEAQHASFCTAARQGVAFPGWKKERVVERWPAEEGAPRVVEVRCSDAAPHVSKLEEVKVLMDSDMGFSHAAMQVRLRLQCSNWGPCSRVLLVCNCAIVTDVYFTLPLCFAHIAACCLLPALCTSLQLAGRSARVSVRGWAQSERLCHSREHHRSLPPEHRH